MRISNPLIALISVVLLLAIHTPWFSPLQISATNQVKRVLEAKSPVETFDADTLRYRLGPPGKQAFEALLEQVEQGRVLAEPARQVLLKRLKDAQAGKAERESDGRLLEWVGPAVEGSEQFNDAKIGGQGCLYPGCAMWAVDLDQDGQDEVLQLPKYKWSDALYFFKRDTQGKWQRTGAYEGVDNPLEMIEQIREGKVKVVKPRYQSLQTGDQELNPKLDTTPQP